MAGKSGSGKPRGPRKVDRYERELEEAHKRIELLSLSDDLTQLPNYRALCERLDVEWARSLRSGQSLSFLLLDLDDFKGFNQRLGHEAGDKALIQVAESLVKCVRSCDFCARYGGEEFGVVLGDTCLEQAMIVAERVRRATSELALDGRTLLTSVGVSSTDVGCPRHPQHLFGMAEKALLVSKKTGLSEPYSLIARALSA